MSSIVRGRRPIPADVDRTTGRYLLAVHRLADGSTDRVSKGALRASLDVTAASVTEMVGKLDDRGYLDHEKYAGVRLTDDGRDAAARLAWRVCVVRTFFDAELGTDLSPARTYEVGYAFPPAGLERLHELVDGPCIDHCPEAGPADRDCPA